MPAPPAPQLPFSQYQGAEISPSDMDSALQSAATPLAKAGLVGAAGMLGGPELGLASMFGSLMDSLHPQQSSGPTPLQGAATSPEDAWMMVEAHMPDIEKAVQMGIKRGVVNPQDAEDALSDARIEALSLAQKHDPAQGSFTNYLRNTLANRFRFDTHAPGADQVIRHSVSLDAPIQGEEGDSGNLAQTLAAPDSPAPGGYHETPTSTPTAENPAGRYADLQGQINTIKGRDADETRKLQNIATDYYVKGLSQKQVTNLRKISDQTFKKATSQITLPKINLADTLHQVLGPQEVENRISQLPANLQPLARQYFNSGNVTDVARATGRNDPTQRTRMIQQLNEILNNWKK